MTVTKQTEGTKVILIPEGRIDSSNASDFEVAAKEAMNGADSFVLDLEKLVYISSAGLRIILSIHKEMKNKGGLVLKNVNDDVMEIFDITGFSKMFIIEK